MTSLQEIKNILLIMVLIVDIVDSNLIHTAARFFSLFRATPADLAELAKQLASGEHTPRTGRTAAMEHTPRKFRLSHFEFLILQLQNCKLVDY